MRVTQTYLDLMDHGIGKSPAAGHVLLETLNDAGRHLYSFHAWTWRSAGPADLATVEDQSYVDLPADFAAIDDAVIDNTVDHDSEFRRVELVSSDAILRLRQSRSQPRGDILSIYFPQWATQADTTSEPTMRALLYPTPQTGLAPTLSMTYQRRWVELADGSEGTQVPNIPREMERALVLLARAHAMQNEGQYDNAEREFTLAFAELGRLVAEDSRRQVQIGVIQGATAQRKAGEARSASNMGTISL